MLNYYQLLDLADFASMEQVKKAYRERVKQYHPDRVNMLGPKLRAMADSEMAVINQAFEQLSDPATRAEFDNWLKRARDGKTFKSCAHCGLEFAPPAERDLVALCPACRRFVEVMDRQRAADAAHSGAQHAISPETVLSACFVVAHHFMTAATVKRFRPTLELLVSGDRLSISGFRGDVELIITNRTLYDAVHPDPRLRKRPWNGPAGRGKIILLSDHPVSAARALWAFCAQALGSPRLDFAHLCINNDNFRPYEHVLNQTAIVAATGISPWIAAKLYSRHGKNVAAACGDHEAALPDPFFRVLASLGPESETMSVDDAAQRAYKFEEHAHELEQKLNQARHERDKAREQALGLSTMVEDLRQSMTVLQGENERIPWLQDQLIQAKIKSEKLTEENAAVHALTHELDSAGQLNAWLQDQVRRIPGLERQILELHKQNQELAAAPPQPAPHNGHLTAEQVSGIVAQILDERLAALPSAQDLLDAVKKALPKKPPQEKKKRSTKNPLK
jgi:hypothetical protein